MRKAGSIDDLPVAIGASISHRRMGLEWLLPNGYACAVAVKNTTKAIQSVCPTSARRRFPNTPLRFI
jgi:L-ribulose-5-phosphate 3-epimerase UlaE